MIPIPIFIQSPCSTCILWYIENQLLYKLYIWYVFCIHICVCVPIWCICIEVMLKLKLRLFACVIFNNRFVFILLYVCLKANMWNLLTLHHRLYAVGIKKNYKYSNTLSIYLFRYTYLYVIDTILLQTFVRIVISLTTR